MQPGTAPDVRRRLPVRRDARLQSFSRSSCAEGTAQARFSPGEVIDFAATRDLPDVAPARTARSAREGGAIQADRTRSRALLRECFHKNSSRNSRTWRRMRMTAAPQAAAFSLRPRNVFFTRELAVPRPREHQEAAQGAGGQGGAGRAGVDRGPARRAREGEGGDGGAWLLRERESGLLRCPGHVLRGRPEGGRRFYRQTFVDTYSKVAFAKLYDRKAPICAAELLSTG